MLKIIFFILIFNISYAEVRFVGQEYPPFNYSENGTVKGEFITVLKNICDKLSEKCTFEINSLKRALHEVESGTADVGITFIKSFDRDQYATFFPMYRSKQVYWGKSEMPVLKTIYDLKEKTAVSVQGSQSLELVKEHAKKVKSIKVVESISNDVALRMLSSDRFGDNGVALVNEIPAKYFIEKFSLSNLKIVLPVKTETYGFYFSKKSRNGEFLKKLKDELSKLKKNKEFKLLYEHISIELASLDSDEFQI